jgi:DNA-binding NarL/FixJ family response regulator
MSTGVNSAPDAAAIRVLIADDDPLVRAGLRAVLANDAKVQVLADASDGREAVDLADRHQFDLVLMDIRMPGMDGLAACREILRRHPQQRIIVLTTFGEADYVRDAVALGVSGFLLKAGDPHDLLRGIHAVVAGGACLSPTVAAMILEDARTLDTSRATARTAAHAIDALTPRERDVLDLVARGFSNAEIAATLYLGEGTVKGYLTTIFTRLGVRNRVEAALAVWQTR